MNNIIENYNELENEFLNNLENTSENSKALIREYFSVIKENLSNDLIKCPLCGKIITNEEEYDLFSLIGVCFDCYYENKEQIKRYHGSTNLIKQHSTEAFQNSFTLGFELEVQVKSGIDKESDEIQAILFQFRDYFHYEHDGSLNSDYEDVYGFEIISHTYSHNFFLFEAQNALKKLLEALKPFIYTSYRCGLHIHINRSLYSNKQLLLIAEFIDSNLAFFEELSNRESFEYCERLSNASNLVNDCYGDLYSEDRYVFFNVQSKTVEYRFFASSKQFEIVNRQIKFILAFTNYTLIKFRVNEDLKLKELLEYISETDTTLFNFIGSRADLDYWI